MEKCSYLGDGFPLNNDDVQDQQVPRCAILQASNKEVNPGWGTARDILGLGPSRKDRLVSPCVGQA